MKKVYVMVTQDKYSLFITTDGLRFCENNVAKTWAKTGFSITICSSSEQAETKIPALYCRKY